MVVVGRLDGPETHEEWALSCGRSSVAGGVSESGNWCGTWDWRNQDGGLITK